MVNLILKQKIFLTVIESFSVFLTVFLNQMIITVFPSYASVQAVTIYTNVLSNCTEQNPSNIYVAVLIGSKYSTELVMFPIVGWIVDNYHPPLVLFFGTIVEAVACIVYSISGAFYSTLVARVIDAIGYSVVSTAGLTIIYMLYVKERPRNKIITIDSILVYVAASVSPFIAGSIYETAARINDNAARVLTFIWMVPMFLALTIAVLPFAFRDSLFSRLINLNESFLTNPSENKFPGKFKDTLLMTEINYPDDPRQSLPPVIENDERNETDDKDIPGPDNDTDQVQIVKTQTIRTLLEDPFIWIVMVSLFFSTLIGNSLEATLPIFMIKKFCSDQFQQGIVWLFGFFSLGGFLFSSILFHFKRQNCWKVPLVGMIFSGSLCVCLYYCDPWWTIGVCLGFIFFFNSMNEVLLIPIIAKIIDVKYSKLYGSGSSLTLLTFTISGLIGTFPVGPLVEKFGFLVLCAILCILNFFISPFVCCLKRYFK